VSTAGYYFDENRIMGFSHARMTGTGASEDGHFSGGGLHSSMLKELLLKEKYFSFN